MPASFDQYSRWSRRMQSRYRRRYGSAPRRPRTPAPEQPQPQPAVPPAAPPGPTPQPFDARYETEMGAVRRDLGNSEADLAANETRIRQEYGFDDPSNPFNRTALLRQSLERNRRAATNSHAAQGQLYSGALQNAQNTVQRNFTQAHDALRREYDDLLSGVQRQRRDVRSAALAGEENAELGRMERYLETRPEDPGAPDEQEPQSQNNLPAGYQSWSLRRRQRYWQRRRRERGQ